jgi:SAM-dependent methyltransferase
MSLYHRVLSIPFVFNHVRPLVVGGVDMSPSYANLGVGPDDVVLDVGCGTGDALNYLERFRTYRGFDTDAGAIEFARKKGADFSARNPGLEDLRFEARLLEARDVAEIAPTKVMLSGLLHHLTDDQTLGLLRMLAAAPSVRRIATCDIVYLPGQHVNNLLSWLDRGRFCRTEAGYERLAEQAGLRIAASKLVKCHPERGRQKYLLLALEPGRA